MNKQTVAKGIFFISAVAIGISIAKSDWSYIFGVMLGYGLAAALDILSEG